jgi:hypothetical protein
MHPSSIRRRHVSAPEAHAAPTHAPVSGGSVGRRRAWLPRLYVALLSAAIFGPMIRQVIYDPQNVGGAAAHDHEWHLTVMMDVFRNGEGPPHFLFHLTTWLLRPLTMQDDFRMAGVIALTASVGAFAVLVFEFFRWSLAPLRLAVPLALAGTLIVQIAENPFGLSGPSSFEFPELWLPLNAYSNPTASFMRPFAFAVFLVVVRMLAGWEPRNRSQAVSISAVAVLASLAKPSLTIVIVIALPLYVLARARSDGGIRRTDLLALKLVVAPLLATLLLQAVLVRFVAPDEFQSFVRLDPFDSFVRWKVATPRFWASLCLPVAVAAIGRRHLRDAPTVLAWLCFAVGVLWFSLFVETGRGGVYGMNLVFGAQFSLLLLFIVSLERLVTWSASPAARPPRVGAGALVATWALVGVYVASGLVMWAAELRLVPVSWR